MCTVSRAWPSLSAAQEMLRTWEGVAKQMGCKSENTCSHMCLRNGSWLLPKCTTIADNYQDRKCTALCLTPHSVFCKAFFLNFFFYFCQSIVTSLECVRISHGPTTFFFFSSLPLTVHFLDRQSKHDAKSWLDKIVTQVTKTSYSQSDDMRIQKWKQKWLFLFIILFA